jgi:hypothetical protein
MGVSLVEFTTMRVLVLAPVLAAMLGCGNTKSEGLPPAESWQASADDPVDPVDRSSPPGNRATRDFDDPHAGVEGAPPLGRRGGGDPHAGIAGAPPLGEADSDGAPDVTKLGLPPPDPNRPIDPSRRIRGKLIVNPKVAARVSRNGAIFLIAKQAGPDGAPVGPPLAVEKLIWDGTPLPFELTDANAMLAGTSLAGDVVVAARYDQDVDAISKQPGDVIGQVRVKVPADNVVLELATVLP